MLWSTLQFVKQLLARGNTVVAGVRNPDRAQNLLELKSQHPDSLSIAAIDVSDVSSIQAWGSMIAETCSSVDVRTSHTRLPAKALRPSLTPCALEHGVCHVFLANALRCKSCPQRGVWA